MNKEQIQEALESMANSTLEGAKRMSLAAAMLWSSGESAHSVNRAIDQAHHTAYVLAEAARLLKGLP
jgi:hypothetical protein